MDNDSPELAQYKADQAHWLAQNQPSILLLMLTTGAAKIQAVFSGGGDSGQIDEVHLLDANGKLMDEAHHKENQEAISKIEDFIYTRLEDMPFDWVNNEGGSGTLTIDVKTGECEIDGQEYVTETVNHEIKGWGNLDHERFNKP